MKIRAIEITNILGTEHVRFAPGSLTVIQGHNGSGKSSIIDALMAVFEGGHDPGLLRRGAKKGQIVLTLDDGTTITKTVTAKGSTVEILDPAGHIVPAPQKFVNQLAEALRVDPARLLLAKPKDLLAVLLEVMPIAFDPDEVMQACGGRPVPNKTLDLDGLAILRKQLYEERAVANKAARDAEGTVTSLRRTLPEQDEKDWGAEAESVRAELAAAVKLVADTQVEIERALGIKQREISAEIDRKMRDLEAERTRRVNEGREKAFAMIEALNLDAALHLDALKARAATATERASAQQRAAGVRESIKTFDAKIRESNIAADRLSEAIEALDKLKAAKLESLPIPGLEVSEGRAYLDGVPWEHVNTARQVETAFQIWDLWAAPFAVLDDAEHFDPATWEAFMAYCLASGRQVIAARVDPGPLKIVPVEAATPALA